VGPGGERGTIRALDPRIAVVVAFIDGDRDRFGVEPIWATLCEQGCGIAPSS
jgi:hypothetical protein